MAWLLGLLVLVLFNAPIWALGGLSNTKVTVLAADTVAAGGFEFEPNVQVLYPSNGAARSADAGYRFTAGLNDAMEVGLSYAAGSVVSDLAYGLKWRCLSNQTTALALLLGLDQSSMGTGVLATCSGGLALSIRGEQNSLDMDFIYDQASGLCSVDAGVGYYFLPVLQGIGEFNYDGQQLRLILPGITWQARSNVLVIAGMGWSLINQVDHVSTLAFTFTL